METVSLASRADKRHMPPSSQVQTSCSVGERDWQNRSLETFGQPRRYHRPDPNWRTKVSTCLIESDWVHLHCYSDALLDVHTRSHRIVVVSGLLLLIFRCRGHW